LRQAQRSRWGAPIAAVGLGLIALGVQAARGDVGGGVGSVIVMTGYAVVLVLFGGRSEVVSLMRGDATDERANQIQVKALAMTASVLVPVLVAGFLVELARGAADLEVWTWLCALAGAVFLVSLAVLSRRS
jgi:zinc transporter ZupT